MSSVMKMKYYGTYTGKLRAEYQAVCDWLASGMRVIGKLMILSVAGIFIYRIVYWLKHSHWLKTSLWDIMPGQCAVFCVRIDDWVGLEKAMKWIFQADILFVMIAMIIITYIIESYVYYES